MWDVLSTGGSSRLERILESERLNITDYVDNRKWGVEGLVKALKKVTLISRYQIGGSIGKGTSLGADHMPDIDVNLFINGLPENSSSQDIEAFLKNQVNVIATHFRTRCWRFCKVLYPTRTTASKSVGLYLYREASKVDLIPGIDFALPDQQYNVVMNRIANAGTNLPWTSLCYAEESVRFMNDKSEFSLNVVRAAKYWNKLCVSMAPLSGRSTIVEIVALRAAQDEVDHHGPTRLLGALVRFFKYMTQPWYNIRIVVRYDRTKYWPTKVHSKMQEWDLQPACFLVDPVNPYRNFMDDQKVQEKWQHFQDGARASLKKIDGGLIGEAIGIGPQPKQDYWDALLALRS